jgi:hypothetical protein
MLKLFFLIFTLALISCGNSKSSKTEERGKTIKPQTGFSAARKILGPLKFSATIKFKTKLLDKEISKSGFSKQKTNSEIVETIELINDSKKTIKGIRNLSSGDGIEFFLSNKKEYCIKFRYEKFICRDTTPEEIEKRTMELWSSPIENIDFLSSFVTWVESGTEKTEFGQTKIYKAKIKKPSSHKKKKGWRSKAKLLSIKGSFKKLKNHIIQSKISWKITTSNNNGNKISIIGDYSHIISKFSGKVSHPPANMVMKDGERKRPLKDLKALTGHKIPKNLKYLYGN